jgi:hypothetical protein
LPSRDASRPRPADHSDRGVNPGGLGRRFGAYAHGQSPGALQGQNEHAGLTWTNPRAAGELVLITVGARFIVDANDQVDRVGRAVVEEHGECLYARPIGRLIGRENWASRPARN